MEFLNITLSSCIGYFSAVLLFLVLEEGAEGEMWCVGFDIVRVVGETSDVVVSFLLSRL